MRWPISRQARAGLAGWWLAVISVSAQAVMAQPIVVASTTSTEQSGLFAKLLPAFKQASGVEVKVVAVGTGQALDMGRRGDADILFVHDRAGEEKIVAEGFALRRYAVMYNDFVLVGPASDPAGLKGQDIVLALRKLSQTHARFVSRGDKSGTHAAELRFWKMAGIAESALGAETGYQSCGCGMGPALNMAAATGSYVLTDRGTWLSFQNRADLQIVVQGDARLFNQYGIMLVNPAKHPHVNAVDGQKFIDWVLSPAGQSVIAHYQIGGEPLFFPNAGTTGQ